MKITTAVTFTSTMLLLSVYLFVQAPAPLDARPHETPTIPIRAVFAILEHENDVARALWTEEIVERGTRQGLAFREDWQAADVHAGPLPALFLRETARNLERTGLRLGLFLGSPHPINAANLLADGQAAAFDALVTAGAPQFFFDTATSRHTAMFADRAVVEACVRCHNEHPDSPKRDWQPGAIMGATTWMYPDEHVTAERAMQLVGALRTSIRTAYAAYLAKARTFPRRPAIGDRWPEHGYALPTEDAFMRELARRTSPATLQGLLEPGAADALSAIEPPKPRAEPAAAPPAPVLVIRAGTRSTRVTIEQRGTRIMVTRLPPGVSTSLTLPAPLHVKLGERAGVEVEYRGKRLELPEPDPETNEVELVIDAPVEKS